MAAVVSMRLSALYQDLSLSPAELRRELLGERASAMEVVVARAIARGELGPKMPPARVVSLPFDLFRHEVLMTLEPVARRPSPRSSTTCSCRWPGSRPPVSRNAGVCGTRGHGAVCRT